MDVKIVRLEPMRVVSFLATGKSPEQEAWDRLRKWAEPLGLWSDKSRRLFGFDNPSPSPGKAEYGYEVWIQVDRDFKDKTGKAKLIDFPGGDFAVARVEVPKGRFEVITETWKKLIDWRKKNGYAFVCNYCLEESIRTDRKYLDEKNLEFILDLYHPIKK